MACAAHAQGLHALSVASDHAGMREVLMAVSGLASLRSLSFRAMAFKAVHGRLDRGALPPPQPPPPRAVFKALRK